MIKVQKFYEILQENEIDFFTGVPDSLLKNFCAYITDHTSKDKNIIAANEGSATALAAGYHLGTGKIGLVYMQNSGLGNIINPVTSLLDLEVFSIPVLFIIGWRGESGIKDEPQHIKQGKITLEQLEVLGISYAILPDTIEETQKVVKNAVDYMEKNQSPYALVVRKNTFDEYELQNKVTTNYELNREEALKIVISNLNEQDVVVSTTGMTSREVFEYREEVNCGHEKDFLTIGSMGHASQIALGIALTKPDKGVYCLDGDGSFIMHMGSIGIIGNLAPINMKHIVINNGAHDSVGGQPTIGFNIDILQIAKACGYKTVLRAQNKAELKKAMDTLKEKGGPSLLEIKVNKGFRRDLGRPTTTPIENKQMFMKFLSC